MVVDKSLNKNTTNNYFKTITVKNKIDFILKHSFESYCLLNNTKKLFSLIRSVLFSKFFEN